MPTPIDFQGYVNPNDPRLGAPQSAPVSPTPQNPTTPSTPAPQGPPGSIPTPNFQFGATGSQFSFANYMQMAIDRQNTINPMLQQRQLLLKHIYDQPLNADEISKLPPEMQRTLQTGDKQEIEMGVRLLNDQISGRQSSEAQTFHFLTQGYQAAVQDLETQKQKQVTQAEFILKNTPSAVLRSTYSPTQLDSLGTALGYPIGTLSDPNFKTDKDVQLAQTQQRININVGGGAGGTDDQVLAGMLAQYKTTGIVPSFGMGNAALRRQFYSAIGKDALGGGDIVSQAASNKALISGSTAALRAQETQLGGAKTSIKTLDKQLTLLESYSSKVDRSGSPILNKYILWTKGQFAGDADTVALQNIVKTASYEFSKILSGAAASIAGATVSSAADAESMINANMTPQQIKTVVSLMKQESQFRLQSQQDTVDSIKNDIKNINSPGGTTTGGGTSYDDYLKSLK